MTWFHLLLMMSVCLKFITEKEDSASVPTQKRHRKEDSFSVDVSHDAEHNTSACTTDSASSHKRRSGPPFSIQGEASRLSALVSFIAEVPTPPTLPHTSTRIPDQKVIHSRLGLLITSTAGSQNG